MQNLMNNLIKILKKDDRIFDDGKLLKNKLTELALKLDQFLIELLLSNKKAKENFFIEKMVKEEKIIVFDKDKFISFVNNKEFLPDSFTSFKNKIGLMTNGDYLKEKSEVVLAWAYKDCVLEGGQDNDDEKRDEIFYNETLSPDEIDRLFEPKVLTNVKKVDAMGEHKVKVIMENDNLIIKGNNLLALCCLKHRYYGKVKLVYIDPPYNTRGAANTFSYNNSFNHSSWLTFMKNRVEIAKEMMARDGFFIASIDHTELFYFGVLLDEIFGRENRLGVLAVVHNPGGRQDDKFFPTAHENMLVYAKNFEQATINPIGISDAKLSEFKYTDKYGRYKLRGFRRSGSNSLKKDRPGLFYPIYYNPRTQKFSLDKKSGNVELLPIDEKGTERCWRWGGKTFIERMKKYIEVKKVKGKYEIYTKERESDYQGEKAKTIWNKPYYTGQTATHELKNLFGKKSFSYPKSPYLMRDILSIATNEEDIVLDFFAGSGTTASVAQKMNRKFIAIEQMDYIEDVPFQRLLKSIKGQKEGIDKELNWKGGGSFVYFELKEWNEEHMSEIQKADTTRKLWNIYKKMKKEAFFRYDIDLLKFDEKEFKKLSLWEQKQVLCECLDKNHLYVNLSEIDDATYKISAEDKEFTKEFYKTVL